MTVDDAWDDVPSFGVPPAMECCVVRPGAYAIVHDAGRVALVRTREGLFLPGGGIEPGEGVDDALVREVREETGLAVRPGEWSARAIAFVDAPAEMLHFEKRGTFVECAPAGPVAAPSEPFHELVWVDAAAAAGIVGDASHRWALVRWLEHRA